MKTSVGCIALCVLTSLACLCLSAPDAAAKPATRASLAGADLVVQEIIIREEGAGEFHDVRINVRVRNRGGARADSTITALIFSPDITGETQVLTSRTPALDGGAYHDADFTIEGIAGSFSGVLLAVADAPITAAPHGQVTEGRQVVSIRTARPAIPIDINNTFGVVFTTAGHTLPLRLRNPLVD